MFCRVLMLGGTQAAAARMCLGSSRRAKLPAGIIKMWHLSSFKGNAVDASYGLQGRRAVCRLLKFPSMACVLHLDFRCAGTDARPFENGQADSRQGHASKDVGTRLSCRPAPRASRGVRSSSKVLSCGSPATGSSAKLFMLGAAAGLPRLAAMSAIAHRSGHQGYDRESSSASCFGVRICSAVCAQDSEHCSGLLCTADHLRVLAHCAEHCMYAPTLAHHSVMTGDAGC